MLCYVEYIGVRYEQLRTHHNILCKIDNGELEIVDANQVKSVEEDIRKKGSYSFFKVY